MQTPLPQILQLSFLHLEKSQGAAHTENNGWPNPGETTLLIMVLPLPGKHLILENIVFLQQYGEPWIQWGQGSRKKQKENFQFFSYILYIFLTSKSGIFLFLCFIDYAITVVPFFLPFIPVHPAPPSHRHFPHLSSCPWIVHTRSLDSLFPMLLLTSPCLFCAYHLCFLFP